MTTLEMKVQQQVPGGSLQVANSWWTPSPRLWCHQDVENPRRGEAPTLGRSHHVSAGDGGCGARGAGSEDKPAAKPRPVSPQIWWVFLLEKAPELWDFFPPRRYQRVNLWPLFKGSTSPARGRGVSHEGAIWGAGAGLRAEPGSDTLSGGHGPHPATLLSVHEPVSPSSPASRRFSPLESPEIPEPTPAPPPSTKRCPMEDSRGQPRSSAAPWGG